jgi:hypothetical protein
MSVHEFKLNGRFALRLLAFPQKGLIPVIKPWSRDYAKSLIYYASLFWRCWIFAWWIFYEWSD